MKSEIFNRGNENERVFIRLARLDLNKNNEDRGRGRT